MTKLHKISDLDLNELYQKRKQKHKAPGSIKRAIVLNNTQSRLVWPSFNMLAGVGVTASLMLLISLIVMQQSQLNLPPSRTELTLVEVHSLDKKSQSLAENVQQRHAQHYQNYLKQQQILASHHKKSAVLHLAAEGWELQTCDQELLTISTELVATLQQLNRVDSSLKTGDYVNVDFDRNGLIVGIFQAETLPHC